MAITLSEALITKKGVLDEEISMARLYQYFMRMYGMKKSEIDELDYRDAMILKELDRADQIERELKKNG